MSVPEIDLDGALENADWPKRRWDLGVKTVDELRAQLASAGMTVAQFKQLPVYSENVGKLPWLADL